MHLVHSRVTKFNLQAQPTVSCLNGPMNQKYLQRDRLNGDIVGLGKKMIAEMQ